MSVEMTESIIRAQSFFVSPGIDNLRRAEEIRLARFGTEARLATLPDIVHARLESPFGSSAWRLPYITTSTAVYVGNVRQDGIPLVVIAHGVGPMATLEGAYEFSRASTDIAFMRQRIFNRLVAGEYGEVSVFSLFDVNGILEYLPGLLTYQDALDHLLIQSLLGPQAEKYLRILAQSDTKSEKPLSDRHVMYSHLGFEQYNLFDEIKDGPVGFYVNADVVGRHSCEDSCTSYCSKVALSHPDAAVRFVALCGEGMPDTIHVGAGEIAL